MRSRGEVQFRHLPARYAGGVPGKRAGATPTPAELGRFSEASGEEQALITLGPTGKIVAWSAAASRLFGYQEHEIRNAHFVELLAPEALFSNLPERLLALAAQLQPVSEEHWCVRSDGARFWAALALRAVVDRHGTLQGFALSARNHSERKQKRRAQQFLADIGLLLDEARSEETLYGLLVNLPVPLLADYCTLHLWGAGQELKVMATSEMQGDQEDAIWGDLWSTSGALDFVRHLERALRSGRAELASIGAGGRSPRQERSQLRTAAPRHPRQLMVVPLVVHGSVAGALTMIALRPEQTYGPLELGQACQFVQLGARAMDRLRAHHELRPT
jgi:PAS domain S-box-containing protein